MSLFCSLDACKVFFHRPSYSITMLCALVSNIKVMLGTFVSLTKLQIFFIFFFIFIVALDLPVIIHISRVLVVHVPFAMSKGLMFTSHLLMHRFSLV